MNDNPSQQKGNAILLTLLIISAILVTSVTLASLTLSQLRSSRNLSDSILAYYSAESGVERAIFQIRQEHRSTNIGDDQHIDFADELENASSWSLTALENKKEYLLQLLEQQSVELDLYDRRDISGRTNIQSVSVSWDGSGTVQASLLNFPSSGNVPWVPGTTASVEKNHLYSSGFTLNMASSSSHVLRLKSLKGDLRNVKIVLHAGFDGNGPIIEIPNYIVLQSKGKFDKGSFLLTSELSASVPLSGIFDYVVFSEDDLQKIIAE